MIKLLLLQAAGYGFLVLGVIGLVLPILQGFLFIAIGLIILSRTTPWAARLLTRFRERHPKAGEMIGMAEVKLDVWQKKVVEYFK